VKNISVNNKTISMCSTVDGYLKYQLYHRIFMAVIFFGSFCILVVLYVCILKSTSTYHVKEKVNETKQCGSSCYVVNSSKENLIPDGEGIVSIDEENKQDKVGRQTKLDNKNLTKCSTGQVVTQTSNESQQKQKRTRRITLAFTLITVFYFISYIPFISLDIFLLHGLFTSTSPSIDVFIAIHIVSSCVFINSTVNCFIYSCFDGRFREEIGMLYKKLCCRHQETV
jgi:hypothetical protein